MSRELVQRKFIENGYYHIFNRGNNKKPLFLDKEDYAYFLSLFDCYLLKESEHRPRWISQQFEGEIELISFCLMPNHFHLLIKQIPERAISQFLQCIMTKYSKYFNKKYNLVGHVFQGRYKARNILNDSDLLNISRYIHHNPKDITKNFLLYTYSSAQFFIQKAPIPQWLKTESIYLCLSGTFGVKKECVHKAYLQYLLM